MDLREEIQKYRQEIKSERMDMSFGEIVNMYREGEIIISPEYQRAFRWDTQRQTEFIESILLGIPFPPIFVATNPDGKWELIDGLQRISTVLSFFGELKNESDKSGSKNGLVLHKGSIIKNLEGITISTIPLEYKLQIKRTPCRVEIILKESDFKMRYELFKRLNTGGEGLSRQEIRNCIYRGLDTRYNEFVSELSHNPIFRECIIINQSSEEMMYYEELVLRYLALKNSGTRYTQPNIQDFMDEYLEGKCKNYSQKEVDVDRKIFQSIMKILEKLKPHEIFKLGRRSFTTSLYDAIMLTLSSMNAELDTMDIDVLAEKISNLKVDPEFKKYVGSASSNPTSITNKVDIAKKLLLDSVVRK